MQGRYTCAGVARGCVYLGRSGMHDVCIWAGAACRVCIPGQKQHAGFVYLSRSYMHDVRTWVGAACRVGVQVQKQPAEQAYLDRNIIHS